MSASHDNADSYPLWRPYEDEPLFVPEMLVGFRALDEADARKLTDYLSALVAQRGVVHTAVAFNAVYFGYDLTFRGYVGGPVDFGAFPALTFGRAADALPIGAMVTVKTGSQPLYAEIIHKEGTEQEGGEDESAAFVRPERLVCDTDAFSPGTVVNAAQLHRLRSHGRWVDADGHLFQQARYTSAGHTEQTDLEQFVAYLLGPGRDQLMAGPLPLLLRDGAGPRQLAAALRAALLTLSEALAATESVRAWNDYSFTVQGLTERLAGTGPLGQADMDWLVRSVARPNRCREGHVRARTIEVGPFLRSLSRTDRGLAGTGYVSALVHANTVVDDHLSAHGHDGVLPSGVHVRLLDARRQGGVWKTGPVPASEGVRRVRADASHAREESGNELADNAIEFDVAPFLRRLPRGQRASDTARAEYHRLLSRFGFSGDLPAGFTLVRGHSRSKEGAPDIR